MSYGDTPGGEQQGPPSPWPAYGAPPSYPGQFGYGSPGGPPPTYRAWGIIAAVGGVLFNLILGLPAALVAQRYSKKVTGLWAAGDPQAAIGASKKARTWLIAATVLDAIGLVLSVVLIAAAATSQSQFSNPSAVAASIKTQLQQRLSDSSSQYYERGVTVTSVVCTSSGTNTDRCVDTFSDGQTGSETAVISNHGASYSTR